MSGNSIFLYYFRSYNCNIKKAKLKKQISFMDDEIDLGNDSFSNGIDQIALKKSCGSVPNGDSKGSSGLKMSESDNRAFSDVPGKFRNTTPVFKRSKVTLNIKKAGDTCLSKAVFL
jgi:hypothetical protein